MKTLFIALAFTMGLSASAEECIPAKPLVNHMREMSFLVDHLYSIYETPDKLIETIEQVQLIRQHLANALLLTPSKIMKLSPQDRGSQLMEFQSYINEMIRLTINLERALRLQPIEADQKISRKRSIDETLALMNKLIGQGHERFRNRN